MSLTIASNSPSIISLGNINKNNLPLQRSWKWAYANTLWSLWRLCKQSWFVFCLQFHQCKLYLCSVFYFESIELKLTLFHNYKHSFWLTDKSCWNFIPRAITHQNLQQQMILMLPSFFEFSSLELHNNYEFTFTCLPVFLCDFLIDYFYNSFPLE